MKKFLTVLLIMVLSFSVFAASSFFDKIKEAIHKIEFTPISIRPLYEDYKADLWNFDNSADFMFLQGAGIDSILIQTRYEAGREEYYPNFDKVNGEFVEQQVNEIAKFSSRSYKTILKAKPTLSLALLRMKYKDFAIEGFVECGFNVAIAMEGGNDLLSCDGMYFYGANATYKDIVDVRVGLHHYSGHYGDEAVVDLWSKTDEKGRLYSERLDMNSDEPGAVSKVAEYVRQDGLVVGLSVRPIKYVRAYFEADFVRKNMNTIRPYVLVPNNVTCTIDNKDMAGRIGGSEDALNSKDDHRFYPYSDKYRAFIFNTGLELSYHFNNAGELSLSYNCRLNQEGQTMYQYNCYKESNPWDVDHTVRLAYEFENAPVAFNVTYYNGRIPMLNYFYYHDSYISLGLSLNL